MSLKFRFKIGKVLCLVTVFIQGAARITPLLGKQIKTKPIKIGHFYYLKTQIM